MPELPEVETIVRELVSCGLVGKKILQVQISSSKLIEKGDVSALVGAHVQRIYRHGKFIIIELDSNCWLLVHLRMTGKFFCDSPVAALMPYEKGRLIFSDRALVFTDVRTFGRWYLTDQIDTFLQSLGQDPFDPEFDKEHFFRAMRATKRQLKALLLDQTVLAGIGNIYADEALFLAHLHPLRPANSLTKKESLKLLEAIMQVLNEGIEHGGSSLGKGKGNFKSIYGDFGKNQERFKVYQRTKQPCLNCGHPIQKIVVTQRSTHFCHHCQN